MQRVNSAELVAAICYWASQRGERLSPIRIVKFLYLADLLHARKNGGRTLTGWPWAFVYFGPYCRESITAIDQAVAAGLLEKIPFESRYDADEHFMYKTALETEPRVAEELPIYVSSPLKAAVKKWADDTPGLLDFVYFNTEPMMGIEPGDRLDFTRARVAEPVRVYSPPKLAPKDLRRGKDIIAALMKRTDIRLTPLDTGPHDPAFWQAVDHDEVEDLQPGYRAGARLGDLSSDEE